MSSTFDLDALVQRVNFTPARNSGGKKERGTSGDDSDETKPRGSLSGEVKEQVEKGSSLLAGGNNLASQVNKSTVNFRTETASSKVAFASSDLKQSIIKQYEQDKGDGDSTIASTGTYNSVVSGRKKYKLFLVKPGEESAICGSHVGQGTTFCTVVRCTTNHRSTSRQKMSEGDLFVSAGAANRAFCSPCISKHLLEEEVSNSWLSDSQTLEDWRRQFRVAALAVYEKEDVVTTLDVQDTVVKTNKALEHKTPKKDKKVPSYVLTPSKKYVPFDGAENLPLWDPNGTDPKPYLDHLDLGLSDHGKLLFDVAQIQQDVEDKLHTSAVTYDVKLMEMQDEVGKRPAGLSDEFEAPSLWGTVGNIGTAVQAIPDNFDKKMLALSHKFDSLLKDTKIDIQVEMKDAIGPIKTKFENFFTSLSTIGNNLKSGLEDSYDRINELAEEVRILKSTRSSHHTDDIRLIVERLERVEVGLTRAEKDSGDNVKFEDLGFGSFDDANAWLEMHCPDGHFGFIVDFHIAMEHISRQINGKEGLKTMTDLYKLKFMTTNAEAIAITSFESQIPRFFTEAGAHRVHSDGASFFSEIKSYNDWSSSLDGFKTEWKKQLQDFRTAHSQTITDAYYLSNAMKTLARVSLSTTVSWCLSFIDFIDNTYQRYSDGKFGAKKAWQVTTKLGRVLIQEVGKPRIGTTNKFPAGKQNLVSAYVFWATLKSLDKMNEVAELDFENHPAVGMELVKFLSINTSVEDVEQLKSQAAVLVNEIKDLKKEVGIAAKNASTNGNKVTEFGPKLTALQKRVEKLEQKAK